MSEGRIFIFGASGHAKVVIDAARRGGQVVAAIFDDDAGLVGRQLLGCPIVGGRDKLQAWCEAEGVKSGVVAIGDNRIRLDIADWLRRVGLGLATVVHPQAMLATAVELGPGTVIMAGVVINPDVRLGDNCIVNTGASIDHDCVVGAAAHVAPGCRLCGNVRIGDGVLLGVGSVVIPGVQVGAWTTVGAGSTVVGDIGPDAVAFGTPCREH